MKLFFLLALLIGLYVTVRLAVSRYRRPEPPPPQAESPAPGRNTIIWQEASIRPPDEKRTVEAPAFLPPVQVHKVGRTRRKTAVPPP